ncbi:MAG: hypothetical protein IPG80_08480 [Anaerolineales bacterium]|jgi:hypothetical protein|uniref:hypothetical protein n=1 Tax=Candidatus Villigracilis vicinus TaxID=3140679 RepID=UPI0031373C76|nr:hypothetical protein [Anaerolineales bacterium]MBK7449490.1 hypothetical protein [Anaerolineales bacterium]MBK9780541.1 hypothetical protein [Anaerolineales bacterium]
MCHSEGAIATEESLVIDVEILTALHPQSGACVATAQDDINVILRHIEINLCHKNPMTFQRFLISGFLAVFLTSCSAMDALLATSTPMPATETPPPTATILWFPPSATSTPQLLSTKAPTPEMRPGLGTDLLTDDFSDRFNWDTATSNEASAEINDNRLTLAVQSQVYMTSLRRDTLLSDYYAEITAQPSLCRGEDSYGILIRANGGSYYRFALACDGTVRAERVNNSVRLVLQQPLPSGDVPPGAPGNVRIGVWVVGGEMRLFLNGRFQFNIYDPSFPIGSIGVFVRSAGETAAVVSFSDLVIQEVNYTPPAVTATP